MQSARGGNWKDFEDCTNENLKGFQVAGKGSVMALREVGHESLKENEENTIRNWKKGDS